MLFGYSTLFLIGIANICVICISLMGLCSFNFMFIKYELIFYAAEFNICFFFQAAAVCKLV